jgi:hypothetical protein
MKITCLIFKISLVELFYFITFVEEKKVNNNAYQYLLKIFKII